MPPGWTLFCGTAVLLLSITTSDSLLVSSTYLSLKLPKYSKFFVAIWASNYKFSWPWPKPSSIGGVVGSLFSFMPVINHNIFFSKQHAVIWLHFILYKVPTIFLIFVDFGEKKIQVNLRHKINICLNTKSHLRKWLVPNEFESHAGQQFYIVCLSNHLQRSLPPKKKKKYQNNVYCSLNIKRI